MKKAFRYRFYPTDEQRQTLAQTFGCVRVVWNWALRLRTDAFTQRKESIGYRALSSLLTQRKQEPDKDWLKDVSSVPLQQTLRHQQRAFENFFAKRANSPRFKRKSARQAAEYTTSAFRWDGQQLRLAKMSEPLHVVWSRPLEGKPTTVTVSKDAAGRYFVSILCEVTDPKPLPVTPRMVGLDLGLTDVLVASDGFKSGAPKFHRRRLAQLRRAQKSFSRKRRGSKNREKARLRVARVHARIADARCDFTHQLSTRLIQENQLIAVESLSARNMVQAKTLAASIHDAAWGELLRQLEYKAARHGRTLVRIDRWFPSSKRCSSCGFVHASMPLSVRRWRCPECGLSQDRDVNAAVNILAAGLAVNACGGDVRPGRPMGLGSPEIPSSRGKEAGT